MTYSTLAVRSFLAVTVALGVHFAVGCASDEHPRLEGVGGSGASTGGYGNPDASLGNGGTGNAGSAATGGGGGASTGGAAADAACVPPTTLLDLSGFKKCVPMDGGGGDAGAGVGPECTDGYCVAIALMTAVGVGPAQLDMLASCDATEKCVPGKFIQYQNKFTLKTCTSVAGAEGRCLSECIPQVSSQKNLLPKDVCDAGELCAPCYDPRTGADTSACRQGCDTGPTQPATVFASCCGGNGSCVPKALVPLANQSQLGVDTCTGTDVLCAPTKLQDLSYVPPTCRSLSNLEGRCMPACIPAIAAQGSFLPQSTCAADEKCAPCYDPIKGTATGACSLNGDTPKEPAATFPVCCNSLGHCVPGSILSTAQQSLLGTDTCTTAGDLCAPDVFADPTQKPTTCTALSKVGLTAEGRCIPSCIPSLQAQAQYLDQSTCSTGYLCAPCYDPLTGASTGACNQNGDAPTQSATTFAACCGTLGICVPSSVVPASQVSQLGQDSCTTGLLCAPKALADPTVKPASCTTMSPLNIEGRCMPGCLPAIQAQASSLKQETCATGELCAPCYNPIDGTATGACSINGDSPVNPAVTFATCCPTNGTDQGTCVPSSLVPASFSSMLTQQTCATGLVCAPTLKVKDITAKFPSCSYGIAALTCYPPVLNTGCSGACLPSCFLTNVSGSNLLSQQKCSTGQLCAPCKNPLDGTSTGACN